MNTFEMQSLTDGISWKIDRESVPVVNHVFDLVSEPLMFAKGVLNSTFVLRFCRIPPESGVRVDLLYKNGPPLQVERCELVRSPLTTGHTPVVLRRLPYCLDSAIFKTEYRSALDMRVAESCGVDVPLMDGQADCLLPSRNMIRFKCVYDNVVKLRQALNAAGKSSSSDIRITVLMTVIASAGNISNPVFTVIETSHDRFLRRCIKQLNEHSSCYDVFFKLIHSPAGMATNSTECTVVTVPTNRAVLAMLDPKYRDYHTRGMDRDDVKCDRNVEVEIVVSGPSRTVDDIQNYLTSGELPKRRLCGVNTNQLTQIQPLMRFAEDSVHRVVGDDDFDVAIST